jgi:hypothetical protein
MGNKRIIDTDAVVDDYEIGEALKERGFLLYERLMGLAEVWGGLVPNYKAIADKTGWLKATPEEIKELIQKLVGLKKIINFRRQRTTFHWLVNVQKYNRTRQTAAPRMPLPPWVKVEEKKYESGKSYWEFTILWNGKGRVPEPYRNHTGTVLEPYRNRTRTLPVGAPNPKEKKPKPLLESKPRVSVGGGEEESAVLTEAEAKDPKIKAFLREKAKKGCEWCKGKGVYQGPATGKEYRCQCTRGP